MKVPKDLNNQKLLIVDDAQIRYQFGHGKLMEEAEKAGAIRKIGRSVRIDREVMDKYVDTLLK